MTPEQVGEAMQREHERLGKLIVAAGDQAGRSLLSDLPSWPHQPNCGGMSSPAFALLAHRSVIAVGGPDRAEFLQGLISNDTPRSGRAGRSGRRC
jgi:hypothetical protein